MSRRGPDKPEFEISFLESVLKRDDAYPEALEMLAGLYTKEGRIEDGLALDRRLVSLDPQNATHHYNLACSLALKGYKTEAVETLRRAIGLGYTDFAWLTKDPDLKPLRGFPPYVELLDEFNIVR